jgi:integrase
VKFPKAITRRGHKVRIYGRTARYRKYRVCYLADGKRHTRVFWIYGLALAAAKSTLRQLVKCNAIGATLSKADAEAYKFAAGKLSTLVADLNARDPEAPAITLSLEDAVTEYCAAKRLLPKAPLTDAVKTYLATVGSVRRMNLKAASDEFLAERAARTKAADGKRASLSPRMAYQDGLRMAKFTNAFGTSLVCELQSEHLDVFFAEHLKDMAPRSRNHYRSTLCVFFKWCVRKSYLPENHGLRKSNGLCPDGKAKEPADVGEVEVYSPDEFANLLKNAQGSLRALVAIGGLAGLRTEELLRLEWCDVWRRAGYIEILGRKSKTRARRLVPSGPLLRLGLNHSGIARKEQSGRTRP